MAAPQERAAIVRLDQTKSNQIKPNQSDSCDSGSQSRGRDADGGQPGWLHHKEDAAIIRLNQTKCKEQEHAM
jgi:hypothetical protein